MRIITNWYCLIRGTTVKKLVYKNKLIFNCARKLSMIKSQILHEC